MLAVVRQPRRLRIAVLCASVLAWLSPRGASAQSTGLGTYQPGTENQIWQQLSYVGSATCVPDPDTGNCTTTPDTSLGTYYFPIQITTDVLSAASGRTTSCAADNRLINYVTDQWNNRVQAFDYCGNPVAFPNAPNGWPTIGGGPAGGTMTAGSGATGLTNPEGIAIDAAHHIIVGDRDNARVAIFNEDGSFLFDIPVPAYSQPTGVAVLPGTVMDPAGAGHGWLAVVLSAYGSSRLQVYDSKGSFIAQNVEDEGSGLPGALSGPSDLTIDSAGRVYVADLYDSRIAGYLVDTTAATVAYEFQFGAPADPSNLQPSDLQYPYSIAFDTLGRLIVGDTGNQRLAVYTISFASPATLQTPDIQYQFYLDARGDLNGYPRGIAQDRQGRLYAVDTTNHRVQRFETPLLAVVNLTTTPAAFVPSGAQMTVTAGVVVPASKVAVTNVVPNVSTSSNVTLLSGPDPVAPTAAVPTPLVNPGEVAYYTWTYATDTGGGSASFTVGATGDPNALGAVSAPTKSVTVSLGCAGCETTPPTTTATLASTKTSGIWRSSPTTVSLTAVDGADVGSPSGIREIRLYLTGAESTAALGLPQCAQQYDGNIEYCISASGAPTTFSTAISLNVEGSTTVWYRAVDEYGNAETAKSVTVVMDISSPVVNFTPLVAANTYGWYGAATSSVTVNYTVADTLSGLPSSVPPGGSLTYSQEGDTFQTVNVTDNVGNAYAASYDVRIDRTAPTIAPSAAQTVELATTAGTAVTLTPTATDALSGIATVTTNAPIVFPLGTTTVTITAKDKADNSATATTTVTVRDTTPPVFTVVPPAVVIATTPVVGTAAMPNLAALAAATDLEAVAITQSTAAGTALNPGVYPVTLTATDAAGNKSTATTSVTVRDLTPPTITACAPAATVSIDPTTSLATVPNMTGGVTAIDNGGGPVSVTQAPAAGTTLGLGTYPVAFTVADLAGNIASCSSTLNVIAVPPPTATIVLSPGLLWPPNHKMVVVKATLTISDPNATVQLVSITSSEPDNGLGDGDRAIDEQTLAGRPISTAYGTDTRQFQLRAERSGRGAGRVYTVTYRITNAAGSIVVSGVVLVPHDMSNEDDRDQWHGDGNGNNGHNGNGNGNNGHNGNGGDDDGHEWDGPHGQLDDGHYPGDGHRTCWANEYPDLWRIAYATRHDRDGRDDRDSSRDDDGRNSGRGGNGKGR